MGASGVAGESGVITKRALDRDAGTRYKIIAFIDDSLTKTGKTLEGVHIYNADGDLEDLLRANTVKQLIISIQNISPHRKQQIVEKCLTYGVKILNVPPVNSWINGELSFKQIKKIKIEEEILYGKIYTDDYETVSKTCKNMF